MGKIKIKITKNLICCLQKANGFLRFLEWGFLRFLDLGFENSGCCYQTCLAFGFDIFGCVVCKREWVFEVSGFCCHTCLVLNLICFLICCCKRGLLGFWILLLPYMSGFGFGFGFEFFSVVVVVAKGEWGF